MMSYLARLPMNVPNILTLLRILCAMIVFAMIAFARYDLALLFFLLASVSDFLDGWWARHYHQVTVFGRIMDPFADKFLICGAFVCLVAIPELTSDKAGFAAWLMLQPWMVIVIIGRELLVTSLRAFVESSGGDFSAKWLGKWKMVLQCAAVILALLYLSGGAEWNIVSYSGQERLVSEFESPPGGKVTWDTVISETGQTTLVPNYVPRGVTARQTVLAQGLDYCFGTKQWRRYVFFTMLASFWLTFGMTVLSGLDYCIHATRMIRKQRERLNELFPDGK